MISQEIIEEFFYKMIEELRSENIPILNNYWQNFRDYPYDEEIRKLEENDNKEDIEENHNKEIEEKINNFENEF